MITVQVKLFASLRRFRPCLAIGEPFSVAVAEGARVRDLVEHLGLPASEVKIIFVNFVASDLERVLANGDELGIFPPVGGG